MDDFESRLKRIPPAKPSDKLRNRIFATPPARAKLTHIFNVPIRLGWAAVIALIAGLVGMNVSQLLTPPAAQQPGTVYIIRASSERNPFDFTETSAQFMPGELTVTVEPPQEI
jgi:hypothetical protein